MKFKTKFTFDDVVKPTADDGENKNNVIKISKIGKNDDGTAIYYGKRIIVNGEPGDNEEIGPFCDDDLEVYVEES